MIKKQTFRQMPTKVNFLGKDGKMRSFKATRCTYPYIELKGEPIESFERVSKIKEIILLGEDGEIRRIIIR